MTTATFDFRPSGEIAGPLDVYRGTELMGEIRMSGGWWTAHMFMTTWGPAGPSTARRTIGIFGTVEQAVHAFDGLEFIR